MGTVTTEQLADWERLANEATGGPWAVDAIMDDSETEIILGYEIPNAGSPIMLAATFDDDDEGPGRITPREGRNNARFIAASRLAVPQLVAEVRRLRGEVAELRGEGLGERRPDRWVVLDRNGLGWEHSLEEGHARRVAKEHGMQLVRIVTFVRNEESDAQP